MLLFWSPREMIITFKCTGLVWCQSCHLVKVAKIYYFKIKKIAFYVIYSFLKGQFPSDSETQYTNYKVCCEKRCTLKSNRITTVQYSIWTLHFLQIWTQLNPCNNLELWTRFDPTLNRQLFETILNFKRAFFHIRLLSIAFMGYFFSAPFFWNSCLLLFMARLFWYTLYKSLKPGFLCCSLLVIDQVC